MALARLGGLVTSLVALKGHGLGELPPLIYSGILVGTHQELVLPAAAVSAATTRWPAP